MKRIFLLSGFLLFLTSCIITGQPASSKPEPVPPTQNALSDRSIYKNGLAPEYQDVLNRLPNASIYEIELNIADDLTHVKGYETVVYTNAEDIALEEVQFRLFANILGGKMEMEEVAINGEVINPKYSLRNSLMTIPLKGALKPKESITLKLRFDLTVAQSVELNYGIQAYYDDVLTLAHAYPMIAVYDDEGWNSEIPPQSGDVTYADISFFLVTVEAPKGVTLVASGSEVSHQKNENRQTTRFEAGPVRDFYLAASQEYEVFTLESGDIKFRFYTRDYLQEGAEAALHVAARATHVFEERYAPYPYTELDFVSTPTLALGIEYPSMIAITESILTPDHPYLEATVAHEVGHQWFYNLVGNDQLDDPWLDESITQFITLQYFTDEYGQAGRRGFRQNLEERWAVLGNAEIPINLPVKSYDTAEYSGIIYGRGALFFDALRDEMGSKVFDNFMQDYTRSNAWEIATPEKLRLKAEEHCKCDLTGLFEKFQIKAP